MTPASFLIGAGLKLGNELAGPIISQSMSEFREQIGWNDTARARKLLYSQQYGSTRLDLSGNYEPYRLNFEQCLTAFNQANWMRADNDEQARAAIWRRLQSNLRFIGVMTNSPYAGDNVPSNHAIRYNRAQEWMRLIDFSSNGPRVENMVHNYHRSLPLAADLKNVTDEELRFHLQRSEVRRKQDRDLIVYPFASWTMGEAAQLKWRAGLDNPTYQSLLASGGNIRPIDQEYADYLNRRIPDPVTLNRWDLARIWNPHIVQRLRLDYDFNSSPIATFFAGAQGVNQETLPFPNEPDGEKNWLRLAWRANRKVPSYSEARHLQFRLRDSGDGIAHTTDGDVPAWTNLHTKAVLEHGGMPSPIADQMVAAVTEPIPLSILEQVGAQVLEHPAMLRMAEQLYPGQPDWLKEALLDHGFDDRHAEMCEAVIRQMARDRAGTDQAGEKKAIRHQRRKIHLERYQLGLSQRSDVINQITDAKYTEDMAEDALINIDLEVELKLAATKLAALKDAYMTGQVNEQAARDKLRLLRINTVRANQYMEEWIWERTTNQKHQTTGDILQTMKAGLMSPQQAVMRLTNLGWRNPDAIAEVAVVQHDMQIAMMKAQAAAQAHQAALIQRQASQVQRAIKEAAKAKAKQVTDVENMNREQVQAVHAKLLAQADYYAKVHESNARYKAAEKKGNQDAMDAELQKQVAAYQRYLQAQTILLTETPGVANVIGPLDTHQAPGPDSGEATADEPAPATGPLEAPTEPARGDAEPPKA